MKRILPIVAALLVAQISWAAPTVEELRLEKAREAMPSVVDRWQDEVSLISSRWQKVMNYPQAKQVAVEAGNWLWQLSKADIQGKKDYDDRPAYWTRLQLTKILRCQQPDFQIGDLERSELLELFEEVSRGRHDLEYLTDAPLKILVTGFDPFLLDRNIEQGNPSGIAALLLDDQVIEYQGKRAEINTVIFPVRYEDFDQGEVEKLLAPFYALNSVDMVVTISQGRSDFDLERFPGRRRSSAAPCNLNHYSGGSADKPVISNVGRYSLLGPEFVEFSLPVELMTKAQGKYKVNDNHSVTALEKGGIQPDKLSELAGATAVQGGGGGYLSNEISYRSIRLRDMLGSSIPTGHIHTPILGESTPERAQPIIAQIKEMLQRALPAL